MASKKAPKSAPGAPTEQPEASEISPRVARRERRRERSREEIIDAARRVLLRDGVAATTIDAIAQEVGLTKAAIYYYYPSKDVLLFEVVFGIHQAQANAIHTAVAKAANGSKAVRAIIKETIGTFNGNMDDFRLAFLHGQVAKPGSVAVSSEQFSKIRPLNDLAYGGAAELLARDWEQTRGRAGVEPRMLAFLAGVASIGILTMKGMVESMGDPLLYSDAQLAEGLARVFESAATP